MKTYKVRPVLIDSSVPSDLLISSVDTYLHKTEHYGCIFEFPYGKDKYVELILISLEDEKIEVGDKYLDDCLLIREAVTSDEDYWSRRPEYKKIIARQSQISPKYITKFIEQYNKGCVEDLEMKRYIIFCPMNT